MTVVKALTILSMPFVAAEAVTGVVSFATGQHSIPPMTGSGTSEGIAVLLGGLCVSIIGALKMSERNQKDEAGRS